MPVKKTKSDTSGRIFLQYGHDSKSCIISTGKTIQKKHWNSQEGKFKLHPDSTTLNQFLDSFKQKVSKVVTKMQEQDIYPGPEDVKKEYELSQKERLPESVILQSMAHLWKEYIKYLKETTSKVTGESRAPRTIYSNENSRESFESFLSENKIEGIKPGKFTLPLFHKWEAYLQTNFASGNSRSKRLKHFKAFLKYSKKLGYPVGFDLDEIAYKERARPKIYITEDELVVIQERPLIGRKDLIRDLIVLGCNVGLRISDLRRVDKNIQGDNIEIQSQKTGEMLIVPITPKVREILQKYNKDLPAIPEPIFRKEVKALFKEIFPETFLQVKVNGEMTTIHKGEFITPHSFIKTLATILSNKGMPVPLIAKVLGKSVQVLLKHYLNATQEEASKQMLELWSEPKKPAKSA